MMSEFATTRVSRDFERIAGAPLTAEELGDESQDVCRCCVVQRLIDRFQRVGERFDEFVLVSNGETCWR